jgi:hypothetical protein
MRNSIVSSQPYNEMKLNVLASFCSIYMDVLLSLKAGKLFSDARAQKNRNRLEQCLSKD